MTSQKIKQLLPILTAFADGKTIQYNTPYSGWTDVVDFDFCQNPECYRIKPEPKLRPWKPEEVPVGALMRPPEKGAVWQIIAVCGCEVFWARHGQGTIKWIFEKNYEHSRDNGKTWHPCGVIE